MKRLILLFTVIFACSTIAMKRADDARDIASALVVSPNSRMQEISIEDLRTVRTKSPEEKEKLFLRAKELFPLARALSAIEQKPNSQVIVWYSNYFGSIMEKTFEWYNQNVFEKLPKSTFWLADLKAWALLSVDKEQLKKNYGPLVAQIENAQKTKTPMNEVECPLTTKSSDVIDEDLAMKTARYKLLSSKQFFQWLAACKNTDLLADEMCNTLCKEYPRDESLRFSLADIGFKSPLLSRTCSKLNNQRLLDVDFSLVYPLLQYLEGIFYAFRIIESNASVPITSIALLLPNKEFTYYMLPNEKEYFENFSRGIQIAATNSLKNGQKFYVTFEPFAYGSDFYDAPYKFSGARMKKNALLQKLAK